MISTSYHTKDTDSSAYVSGYDVFLQRTNFREKILAKFKESLPPSLSTKRLIRVLDIGCGNGAMTRRYLEILKQVFREAELEVHLLEPSSESLSKANEAVAPLVKSVIKINQTADQYIINSNEAFDLIIASHVFYHVPVTIVPQIIRKLSPDGGMSIMMGAKVHPLRVHPDLKSISKHGDSDALKEILSSLIENDVITSNLLSVKTDMDLNGLWHNGILSEDGKKFFSFTYNVDMNKFPETGRVALNSVLEEVFTNQNGIVHPSHEIIWVKKK